MKPIEQRIFLEFPGKRKRRVDNPLWEPHLTPTYGDCIEITPKMIEVSVELLADQITRTTRELLRTKKLVNGKKMWVGWILQQ